MEVGFLGVVAIILFAFFRIFDKVGVETIEHSTRIGFDEWFHTDCPVKSKPGLSPNQYPTYDHFLFERLLAGGGDDLDHCKFPQFSNV